MADNLAITTGGGTTIAADDISSVWYQRVKISLGADGTAVDATAGNGASSAAVQRVTLAQDSTGQVRTAMQFVTVDFTVQTTALDVGDVIADTQVVTNATAVADMPAILHSITIIDPDDQGALTNVVLFDANTTLGTEDSAPDIDDTEAQTVQGIIIILAADWVDLGGAKVFHRSNLNMIVKPASGTRDIYAALYTPATSTPTYAGAHIYMRLGFR